MKSHRFLMSSDQLELLLAFEERKGLSSLAESMGRDPSVVSRGLQRIAEKFPVLVKVKGKWEITPLGLKLNELTRTFLSEQKSLITAAQTISEPKKFAPNPKTTLIIVNAQQGLLDATQSGRNNTDAEQNIEKLLKYWRSQRMPVIHVRHVSESPNSIYSRQSAGSQFLPNLSPIGAEILIEKAKSSSFSGTTLEIVLKEIDSDHLVLTGFTANECIDATARDASERGFSTYVVGDATAMFDLKATDGKLLKADRVHKLTLANMAALYANVVNTSELV